MEAERSEVNLRGDRPCTRISTPIWARDVIVPAYVIRFRFQHAKYLKASELSLPTIYAYAYFMTFVLEHFLLSYRILFRLCGCLTQAQALKPTY